MCCCEPLERQLRGGPLQQTAVRIVLTETQSCQHLAAQRLGKSGNGQACGGLFSGCFAIWAQQCMCNIRLPVEDEILQSLYISSNWSGDTLAIKFSTCAHPAIHWGLM